MKKVYLSALALLGSATSLLAQDALVRKPLNLTPVRQEAPGRNCATMEVFEGQLAADPARAQRMEAIEAQTRRYLAQPTMLQRSSATADGVITIPVVVHVVYNTADQNVPQSQIDAQIKVLNDDFARMNSDAGNVPALYAGVASATNVRFVLATRTPTGGATNGVVRVSTKTRSFSSNDAVKNSKRGGSDAWPAGSYLNLWLCNLGSGLLGYAQFPGGPAATDGVVCLYSSVPGGTATSYNLGRTATHEVGHWLNLRHIWGDASCGNDLVADTPTQQTSNGGCPVFPKITCNNQGDMSMNYMDYTFDRCMYMFTAGQSSRMDALFTVGGARESLKTSNGAAVQRQVAAVAPVSFYPNPASDVLNLEIPGKTKSTYAISVYDLRGQQMSQVRYDGDGHVQVASLPKGLYYIRIANGTEVTHQRFEKE
ncbi:M43 family zinc metalloprotease [Hymenobacter arizonensis]|uniref:Por secretion system C-terminal sorting domain-containing protein n=1 Tax=Hymenobacter arizonensis TaxID=1227077 RepID=A0A1I5Y264_HYMAR|nr:M43 family zinc metalloprotease [Hymenobacter arizonensis]SFQ38224.1 Por secretion system C-terminal sorting domain-containing protein [Hymenobacter arizonensis]